MKAQISFDLLMKDSMSFIEGTFRLPHHDWQVFIFGPDSTVSMPEVNTRARWESGITGVFVKWPQSLALNKAAVLQVLSEHLRVCEWEEVNGPDSIQLR
ncbi:MAG: hypothetical protein ACHRHE_08930 [Tepidisphaerales bacterium]